MKTNLSCVSLLLLAALLFSGCQTSSRMEVLGPLSRDEKFPPAETDPIENRIRHLEQMLLSLSDNIEPDYKRVVSRFIDSYSNLQKLLILSGPNSNNAQIINKIFREIVFIEEQYFAGERSKPESLAHDLEQYHKENFAIFESFLSGDYQGVISRCLALEQSFGSQALTLETGLIFALALAENDTGEAIEVGERVMKQLEGRPDLVLLRAGLIEWYLAEGKRDKAVDVYGKLSDDLDERNSLFYRTGRRLTGSPAKDEGGEKADRKTGEIPPGTPLIITMQEADQLVQKQAYAEAELLLIKARIKTDNESEIRIIDQALKNIEINRNRIEQGGAPVDESSEKEKLELAAVLIEEEKYEEAITALEKIIINQPFPDYETGRLKNLAVEKIINRDRNRAAQLYLQARQVQEPAKKKALLQSSLNILKALADKYSSSPLIERVNSHITIVEKALSDF